MTPQTMALTWGPQQETKVKAQAAVKVKAQAAVKVKAQAAVKVKAQAAVKVKAQAAVKAKAQAAVKVKAQAVVKVKVPEAVKVKAQAAVKAKAQAAVKVKAVSKAVKVWTLWMPRLLTMEGIKELLLQRMIQWELQWIKHLRKVTPKKCRQMEVKKIQWEMRSQKQMMVFQRKTKTINL
jgi:hypothetical protein